jgi:hypothetical protein
MKMRGLALARNVLPHRTLQDIPAKVYAGDELFDFFADGCCYWNAAFVLVCTYFFFIGYRSLEIKNVMTYVLSRFAVLLVMKEWWGL